MSVVATLLVRVAADMHGFAESFAEASRAADELSKDFAKVGTNLKDIGGKLTTSISLPLAGIAAAATSSFISFDNAMAGVQAAVQPTAAELETLKAAALEWGQKTTFSATEAADALGELGKAGVSTANSVKLLPNVLNLATVGQMSLADAATLTSDTLNQYRLSADQAGHVNDVLAKAAQASTISVQDLGQSLKYVGPVAAGLGMTLDETAGALAQLGNLGFKASTAGTALRSALADAKTPTKAMRDVLGELNIATLQSSDGTVHLAEIIRKLQEAGADTGQIMHAFGKEAGPALAALVSGGADALDKLTVAMEHSDGTAQAVAETLNSGLGGAIEGMKGALDTAAISIGELLAPALTAVANIVGDLASWVSSTLVPAFKQLPGPVQAVTGALLLLVAAIGPVVYFGGALVTSWSAIAGLFSAVAAETSAVALGAEAVATGLAAEATGATLATAATSAFASIIAVLTSPITLVVGAVVALVAGLRYLTGSWEGVLKVLTLGLVDFKTLATIWEGLKSIGAGLASAFDVVRTAIGFVVAQVGHELSPGLAAVQSLFVDIATTIGGVLMRAWQSMHDAFVAFTSSGVGKLIYAMAELQVKLQIAGILGALKLGFDLLTTSAGYLSDAIVWAVRVVRDLWSGAVSAAQSQISGWVNALKTVSAWFGVDLVSVISTATSKISGFASTVDTVLTKIANALHVAAAAVPGLSDALKSIESNAKAAAAPGAVPSLAGAVGDLGSALAGVKWENYTGGANTAARTTHATAEELKAAAKAAQKAAEEHAKFLASLSGTDAIANVQKFTDALAELRARGLKPSVEGMKDIRDALDKAADVIRDSGKQVPEAMGRLWASLLPPTKVASEFQNFWVDFGKMFKDKAPQQVIPSVRTLVGKIDSTLSGIKWENVLPSPQERAAITAAINQWTAELKQSVQHGLSDMFTGATSFGDGLRSMFGSARQMGTNMIDSMIGGFSDQLDGFFSGKGFNWGEMFGTGGDFSAKGAMAAAAAGASVGAAFAHQFNTAVGVAAGAAAGLMAGLMTGNVWAGVIGAGVGAVSAWFQGSREKKAQEQAMAQARTELLGAFNNVEDLHAAADRLGVSWGRLWETKKVEDFSQALNALNAGLTEEQNALDELGASLDATAASGALLTKELAAAMVARPHGSDAGLAAFVQGQTDAAIKGFDAFLSNTTVRTQQGATAMASTLAAVYQQMVDLGTAPTKAFAALEPVIGKLQTQLTAAGFSGTAAFQPLADLARLSADTIAGPVFDAMAGLEQGLTATFNMGLLNQEAFSGFTAEIYAGYHALELQGRGGETALMGMRGALQKVWELQQDFGYETTENEQQLLDMAKSAGLIGDQFRPAADRMASAIDKLIERLDKFIDHMTGALPEAAGKAAGAASDAFERNWHPRLDPPDWRTPGGSTVDDSGPGPATATMTIPAFGAGAIVRRPTVALIGESGPEAVVPLADDFRSETDLTVMLDSEVITRAVLRKQPRVLRAYGAAR